MDGIFHGQRSTATFYEALKELLQRKGVDPKKPVIYYCAGGIRSAYAWMVHQLAGLPGARSYEGGFEAWKRLSSQ